MGTARKKGTKLTTVLCKYAAARVPKKNTSERSIRVLILTRLIFSNFAKNSQFAPFFVKKTEKILDSAKHGGDYFPRTQKNIESSQNIGLAHGSSYRHSALLYRIDQGHPPPGSSPGPLAGCTKRRAPRDALFVRSTEPFHHHI